MKAESKHCETCEYVAKEVTDYPCCDCIRHCYYKNIYTPAIEKIENEMYKIDSKGEFVYNLSQRQIFDKCLEILRWEDEE